MRTLVSIRSLLEEVNAPLLCPLCGPASSPLPTITGHLDVSRKGTVTIVRTADCPEHGHFTLTQAIKAAQMHGRDAQIIPQYE